MKSALEALYARCAIQIHTFTFFTFCALLAVGHSTLQTDWLPTIAHALAAVSLVSVTICLVTCLVILIVEAVWMCRFVSTCCAQENFNLKHIADAPLDRPDPQSTGDKERLRGLRRRCKKLRLRLTQRSVFGHLNMSVGWQIEKQLT